MGKIPDGTGKDSEDRMDKALTVEFGIHIMGIVRICISWS
jgi:hypothetical protein